MTPEALAARVSAALARGDLAAALDAYRAAARRRAPGERGLGQSGRSAAGGGRCGAKPARGRRSRASLRPKTEARQGIFHDWRVKGS